MTGKMIKPLDHLKWGRVLVTFAICFLVCSGIGVAETNVRGLDPVQDATYFPELGGLINKIAHNQYGQRRDLSECVVMRRSPVKDGQVHVPAGGLYYASDTSYDAKPLMRDLLDTEFESADHRKFRVNRSLRDVEPEVNLIMKDLTGASVEDAE